MSTSDSTNPLLTVNEQMAAWYAIGRAGSADGSLVVPRASQYGEQMMVDVYGARTPELAREGTRWVVTNTQGTAIVDGNVAAFGATTPTMIIVNNNATGGQWIQPVRLKLVVVAVGTSSTNFQGRWVMDTGNRYSTGGSQLTPTNPNNQVTATKTGALVYFGALTATAANNARTLNLHQLRSVIPVAGDQYTFEFANSTMRSVGMATDGTAQLSYMEVVVPCPIPPGSSLLWYSWGASQAAARSFDHIVLEYDEK